MSDTTESTVFGRYRLVDLIAKGGMAEVFRAKLDGAAGTEKQVCIKRILPRLSKNSEFISLFVEEARIVLPLTHGNITQVFDFGEVDGVYFLAMEYIRGQNLAQVLARLAERGAGLDIGASLYIAAEVCRGLQYAHSYTNGEGKSVVVVHRDVSPHNILTSYNGEVKLTDFGIARAMSKVAETDAVVRGKPCYVSPEQVDGGGGDPRSDIFSLGTVLYEMLTGRRPFEAESDAETLERVRVAKVVPPSEGNDAVDASIDAIVLKAMARDPGDRYQRAGDLQVDLSRALHERSADFTAGRLATRIKELFAWDLAQAEGGGADDGGGRDRLLSQLARAGVDVDDKNVTTDELLQMGTVALETKPMPAPGRWKLFAAVIVLILFAGGAVGVAVGFGGGKTSTTGGKETSAAALAKLPVGDPTDHLTPKSLRQPQGGGVTSPATRASSPAGTASGTASGTGAGRTPAGHHATVAASPPAYLNCNSWPWSVVYVDGRRLHGNTPIYRVKVLAGRHRLKFVNPELGLRKEVTVSVAAGKIKTVAVSLQQ